MPAIAVSMLAGLATGFWLPVHTIAVAVCAGFTALLAVWLRLLPLLAFSTGCVLAALAVSDYQFARLPMLLEGHDLPVSGCIVDIPVKASRRSSFTFRINAADGWSGSSQLVRLSSYDPAFAGRAGDCLRLIVRLKAPHGTFNPGAFDRELWMFARDLHASGYIRQVRGALPAGEAWWLVLVRMRVSLAEHTGPLMSDGQIRSVVHGITLGLRQEVDDDLWDTFRRTGTAHLMAISGLHVGLVGWFGWSIGFGLALLAGRADMQLAAAGSLLCAFVYAMFGGWTLPTQRALLMAVFALALLVRLRPVCRGEVLAGPAIILFCCWPVGIYTGGFWLSFIAVGCLLLAGRRYAPSGRLAAAVYPQLAIFGGLAVPTVLLFGGLSLVAVVANFVAIPVFGLAILPPSLAATVLAPFLPDAAGLLLDVATFVLAGLLEFLDWLAAIPWAWLEAGSSSAIIVVVAIVLAAHVSRSAGVGILILAAALCLVVQRPASVPLRVTVIDVGQGLAVLVRTRRHTLLYDAGAAWEGGDAGRSVILPLLSHFGVHHLNALVVSHDDNDHRGGVASVYAGVSVAAGFAPVPNRAAENSWSCRAGQRWVWDRVQFEFLHPRRPAGWSDNNASCVLRISYKNTAVLLPGDIEAVAERVLLGRRAPLRADLVVAPHHGSATSSTPGFVAAVRPAYVVFSTGYRNRWGFPAAPVIDRYATAGACGLNTAATGALQFQIKRDGSLVLRPPGAGSPLRPWFLRQPRQHACTDS